MSERTSFIELPPTNRVKAVESVRRHLRALAQRVGRPLPEDAPLLQPAEAWLERMRSALCDAETTTRSIAEMDAAMREALPEVEGNEVGRRLSEFVAVRNAIPPAATNTKQALPAVLENLLSKAAA
jgi:hypothetical protein